MCITDTQYLLVRHLDQPHPHCHLVYNRVGNNGQTISDKNIKIRNAKVCRELTGKYGVYLAPGKDDVRRERLREPNKTRYEIYDAIKGSLPKCKSWNDLEGKLKEQGIGVRYKYCGNTDRKQGVLFSKNGFEFSGSKIDRAFSFTKLDNRFNHIQQQSQHRTTLLGNLSAGAGSYRSALDVYKRQLEVIAAALAARGIRLSQFDVTMRLGSTEGIKAFVRNSDAMAIVSVISVVDELRSGALRIVDIEGLTLSRDFVFVHAEAEPARLARRFIDFARADF